MGIQSYPYTVISYYISYYHGFLIFVIVSIMITIMIYYILYFCIYIYIIYMYLIHSSLVRQKNISMLPMSQVAEPRGALGMHKNGSANAKLPRLCLSAPVSLTRASA